MAKQITLRGVNMERKSIDKKLETLLKDPTTLFVTSYTSRKPFIGTLSPEEAEQKIISTYQSITDLIKRREKLNQIVLEVNGTTMVTVPKFINLEKYDPNDTEEISIAAAINRKKYYIDFLNNILLTVMKARLDYNIKRYEDSVDNMNTMYERDVANQFGVTSTQSSKARIEYAESIKDNYKATLIDPLKLQNKIEIIQNTISDYIRDIDNIISNICESIVIDVDEYDPWTDNKELDDTHIKK